MQNIRNIAIIAHVDHGKTTLVTIIHATNIFRENQESGELIMDNNDLEREEGSRSYPRIFLLLIKTRKLT
jgi:GTP-binding protein